MCLSVRSSSYRRLMGAIQSRTSSVVACRDTASWALQVFARALISGMRPTVETVTLLGENCRPCVWHRMLIDLLTASKLCRGSPMPYN